MKRSFEKAFLLVTTLACYSGLAAAQVATFDTSVTGKLLDEVKGVISSRPQPPKPGHPGQPGNNHGNNNGHNNPGNNNGHINPGGNNGHNNPGGNNGHNNPGNNNGHNNPGNHNGPGNNNNPWDNNHGNNNGHNNPGNNNGHNNPWDNNHNGPGNHPGPYNPNPYGPGSHPGPWTPNPGHGSHNNPWDHHNGHTTPWNPTPWTPPTPYPNQWEMRNVSFQSGMFTFSSDAQASFNSAITVLSRAGYRMLDTRILGNYYTLSFMAPARAAIERFESGQYTFASEARAGLDAAVRALAADSKLVIEARLNGNSFVISYVEDNAHGYQMRDVVFASGMFTFSSEAAASLQQALTALRIADIMVMESRLTYNSYTLRLKSFLPVRVQSYAGGQYSFSSDAQAGLNQAVSSMQAAGMVVLEARRSNNTFVISYLERTY
ncbi:MAG TPA: hypothetical protein DCZ92_04760 [Elusimicrobia bacterium]|nr:MAG: hypothetical protein A2016_03600 [Elusimicrobia bacterium GWF2_62_30]HBA60119.1 hypothetical protein [Elusimicrobiota bacterium]